jgi:hypothetical protein
LIWRARIGPRDTGIETTGPTPELAAIRLLHAAEARGWWWDSGWTDRM